jgi:hypothetical protein
MSDATERAASLRTAHRALLAAIALCAVAAWMQPSPGDEPAPDPTVTTVAIVMGLAVMLLRAGARSSVIAPETRTALTWAGWACALALALLGVFVAFQLQQPRAGVAFSLAALIFSLQPPRVVTAGD